MQRELPGESENLQNSRQHTMGTLGVGGTHSHQVAKSSVTRMGGESRVKDRHLVEVPMAWVGGGGRVDVLGTVWCRQGHRAK